MDIQPAHLEIIRDILNKHLPDDIDVWVFGSRAKQTAGRSSDLDLALEGKCAIEADIITRINCHFEDSDLPYEVDVLDLAVVGQGFRKIIEGQRTLLDRKP